MRLVFIDFEASSLDRESWPIEIGVAWIERGEIRVRDSLIRPDPSWPETAWSAASAEIHGVTRAELDAAPTAVDVAREFAALMQHARVVSDAPPWDQWWLGRLLDLLPAEERPNVALVDFDHLAMVSFAGYALDRLFERLELIKAPHRAGPDARRLARAWQAASR